MLGFLAGRRELTPTESRPVLDGMPGHARANRRTGFAVLACYLAAAIIVTWRLWADPASSFVAPNGGDADLFAWYLRYAATAVSHGHLPALVTSAMNAPTGVNMMWNTSLLLPGVLLAPVTLLAGPQVSLTILSTVGFAGSAAAMFVVLRRWRVSTQSAALAGAVYGFSPALLHSAIGHYNLQLAMLPPLIIDAGVRLAAGRIPRAGDAAAVRAGDAVAVRAGDAVAVRAGDAAAVQAGDAAAAQAGLATVPRAGWAAARPAGWAAAVRSGAWLGLLLAAQLFISEEMALLTALAGVLFVAALAAGRPRAVAARIGPAVAGLAVAAAVTLALTGHALRVQFHGPLVQHGPLYPPDYYVNEFSGFVKPSMYLLFHTAGTAASAASYHAGTTEYLAYLGWPLLIALAAAAAAAWRRPAAKAAAFTLVVLAVFSFGGHPQTRGVANPAVSLPWHWLEEHQLLSSVLPDRFSILIDAAAAVLLALGIDAVVARHVTGRDVAGRDVAGRDVGGRHAAAAGQAAAVRGWPGARAGDRAPAVALAVAVLACLPLLPAPLPAGSATPLPSGWSRTFTTLHLPAGARVLVIPVPTNLLTAAMRWQADTAQPAALVGGYFIGPGAGGQAYIGGNGVSPTAWYLDRLWAGGLPPDSPFALAALTAGLPVSGPSGPAAAGQAPGREQVLADLEFWHPAAVVAVTAASSPLASYLISLLGPPSVQSGTVLAWRR
jgi:hypothetical protein